MSNANMQVQRLAYQLGLSANEFLDLTEWMLEKQIPAKEVLVFLKQLLMDEIAK